jgi:hypothetical protein
MCQLVVRVPDRRRPGPRLPNEFALSPVALQGDHEAVRKDSTGPTVFIGDQWAKSFAAGVKIV